MEKQVTSWRTDGAADEEYIKTLQREMSYSHYSDQEKKMLELALKWFYETHEV